jgi:uncharacterized protein (DUF433 family)
MKLATLHRHVERTERGLVARGTRFTLYQLMDYVLGGWSTKQIADHLCEMLSREQIDDMLAYIDENREDFMREYWEIVRQDDEEEAFWREKEKPIRARIEAAGPQPGKEHIWEKLQEWKARIAAME